MTQKEICDQARTNWISGVLSVLAVISVSIGILSFFYGLTLDYGKIEVISAAIALIVFSAAVGGFSVVVRAAYLYILSQENNV